jgi:hypothetical protein
LPIPTAWLPWPGNTNATATILPLFAPARRQALASGAKSAPKDNAIRGKSSAEGKPPDTAGEP